MIANARKITFGIMNNFDVNITVLLIPTLYLAKVPYLVSVLISFCGMRQSSSVLLIAKIIHWRQRGSKDKRMFACVKKLSSGIGIDIFV